MNVYVDDLRDCPEGFTIARTFEEAVTLLEQHEVDILSLDHDLGEDAEGNLLPTGYDFNYGHGNLPPLPSFMPAFDEGFTTMCQRPYQYPLRFTICKLEKRGD